MAGLPDGYTIDAPTAPSGQSGLPDGYTIDQTKPFITDDDFKKSLATGVVKSGTQVAGLPVSIANALRKAYAGMRGQEYSGDINTGSPQDLQDKFSKYVAPLHTPETEGGGWAETAGKIAPALAAPLASAAGYGASLAAGKATEGTPYQDLAELSAGLAGGTSSVKGSIARAAAKASENSRVTSSGLREAGADPALVQKIQTLEQAKLKAGMSEKPLNQSLRDELSDVQLSDKKRDQFSPEDQSGIQSLIDTGASTKTNLLSKGWGTPTAAALLTDQIPVIGPAISAGVIGGVTGAKALRWVADRRTDKAFENLKADIASNHVPDGPPPPQPTDPKQLKLQMDAFVNQRKALAAAQPAEAAPLSGLPDPTQLKLQMDKLVNERQVFAKAQDAQQPAPLPTPPPAPPPINPNALPTSITTPAKNIMGGLANVQEMQAAANPLAKYDAAVQANAARDRSTNSALKQDATGLMAARKAAQAAEEANAEPVEPAPAPEPDHTSAQIKDAMQLMAARKANAKLAATQAAPTAPPVTTNISKKNGTVKETQAPPPEAPTAPPSGGATAAELPQSDYSHLPLTAAAHLITQKAFAKGKQIGVTHEEYASGVLDKLRAKESIADQMAEAMPAQEHQDINAHLQGAKTKAQALDVMNHYIKLHPEAEPAIRLAMAKKRLNAGWAR